MKRRILIVEDCAKTRKLLQQLLEADADLMVDAVDNGKEALDTLLQQTYSVVLTKMVQRSLRLWWGNGKGIDLSLSPERYVHVVLELGHQCSWESCLQYIHVQTLVDMFMIGFVLDTGWLNILAPNIHAHKYIWKPI